MQKQINHKKYLVTLALIALVAGCSKESSSSRGASGDNGSYSSGNSAGSQADNTGRNVRDRSDNTLTPGDQGGSESDRDLTRRIRRAITSDNQLSADAKNVKIITQDGKVTLRGPVNTAEEKKSIAALAQQNGATSVDDQLEIISNAQNQNTTK